MAIFNSADILLPKNVDFAKWSVVACDQYSSEPEYWKKAAELVGENPSTLNLVYPEAFLSEGDARIEKIRKCDFKLVIKDENGNVIPNANIKVDMTEHEFQWGTAINSKIIEAGESAEQAVVREIRAEVGIEVENVRYITSQAWPFPDQLMLAFKADYKKGKIQPQEKEIEEAMWFKRDELPAIPKPGSVAWKLIMGEL